MKHFHNFGWRMRQSRRAVSVLAFAFCLFTFAFAPRAHAAPTVSDVAKELVCDCPDCGRQALDQCPNCEKGREYRALIGERLKQGQSKTQIINYFADTYGEHMLGNPRPQGFGQMAFALPAMAVLLGIVPLALTLRSRRKTGQADATVGVAVTRVKSARKVGSSASAALASADDARVAAALRDYDF